MMKLNYPCRGAISSRFGWRLKPKVGWHSGLDIVIPNGTIVNTAYKGVCVFTGWRGNYGNAVILHHPTLGNVWTLYAHLGKILINVRDWVEGGKIALSDNTGYSTGEHLHFEVRVGANTIIAAKNPEQYLA